MSAVAETAIDAAAGDRLARRNAMILAVAQALAGGNNVVLIATGAIVGAMLAPDRSLATVPVSIYVVGMWIGALPRGWIARHYGRRAIDALAPFPASRAKAALAEAVEFAVARAY